MAQQSLSGRVVTLTAVSVGDIYYANAGDTAWTLATNNTGESPPLNISGPIFSTPNQQKLWYVDGINAVVYAPIINTVELWAATAGTFPVDANGNLPTLVTTWRGRNLLSGLELDPQNIFATAVDGPTDFDYAPAEPSATSAWALNLSPLGLIGDVINCMIPYSDDVLIVGGDHTIWMIQGDPADAGQTALVSDSIGMAWGRPFTKDPKGNVYFFSNRTGIYTMVPGQQPLRISQGIEPLLQDVDTGNNIVRMLWNDRGQSLHVFITPVDKPSPATHFVYEQRTGAWFTDKFANKNHNPIACCVFDGNEARDRVALIGSWTGHVFALSVDAEDDDGTPIASEVVIGPLLTKDMDDLTLKDLQAVMATESEDVTYEILAGSSAEEALASEPVDTGTWEPGRNINTYVRVSDHAIYIRIKSSRPWAMEAIRARIEGRGRIRARQQ